MENSFTIGNNPHRLTTNEVHHLTKEVVPRVMFFNNPVDYFKNRYKTLSKESKDAFEIIREICLETASFVKNVDDDSNEKTGVGAHQLKDGLYSKDGGPNKYFIKQLQMAGFKRTDLISYMHDTYNSTGAYSAILEAVDHVYGNNAP